jgi:hypothetical protein
MRNAIIVRRKYIIDRISSYGLDFEMQRNQRENEALERWD